MVGSWFTFDMGMKKTPTLLRRACINIDLFKTYFNFTVRLAYEVLLVLRVVVKLVSKVWVIILLTISCLSRWRDSGKYRPFPTPCTLSLWYCKSRLHLNEIWQSKQHVVLWNWYWFQGDQRWDVWMLSGVSVIERAHFRHNLRSYDVTM